VDYGSRAAYTPTAEGFIVTAVLERQGSFVLSDSSGSTTTPLTLPIGEVGGSNATACSGNNLVIDFAGPIATVQILFDKRPL
jgi:hypothetical protein